MMIKKDKTLPGRNESLPISGIHYVNSRSIIPPYPANTEHVIFGMGCFWGAEKCFWPLHGVYSTAVGYAAGDTPNPTYQEVCSGLTNHNEVVLVIYDKQLISFKDLLTVFWQSHDPTQGMRQGNDRGTQYRSGIYTSNQPQLELAIQSRDDYQKNLHAAGYGTITTEIELARNFYYAEEYHQQYLAKNPNGYCGLGGTGVSFID